MYGKPFNPHRPYGIVIGGPGFAFDQDGQLYNAMKEPVDLSGNVMPLDPGASEEPEAPVVKSEPMPVAEDPEDIPEDEKSFDLLGWASGKADLKNTPWAKVKAETARLIEDMTAITSKEAARKAILAHYGL
jgi:hypothetical protein